MTNESRCLSDTITRAVLIALIVIFFGACILKMFPQLLHIQKTSAEPVPASGLPSPGAGKSALPDSRNSSEAVTVSVQKTVPASITKTVKVSGTISSHSEIAIYPQTNGRVTRIVKETGDTIHAGDIIGYIDPSRPGNAYAENPITSSVSGTIIDLPVFSGDTVNTGTKFATVGSLDDLEAIVNVSEKYISYLRNGSRAYISVPSLPGKKIPSRVSRISPIVTSSTRTVQVTVPVSGVTAAVKPGMSASAEIETERQDNTIVIPVSALTTFNGEDAVYTAITGNNGEVTAQAVNVSTGLSNDTQVQILAGLAPGDLVITAGSVTSGQNIRIVSEE